MNNLRTMTSKFAGTCYGCERPIAKGETIHYAGPGQAYHPTCPIRTDKPAPAARPRRARHGSRYTRFSSGAEVYTNVRGRCEDAPCCGCCS